MSDYAKRLAELMRQFLGEAILEALYDDDIEEVYVNPDMIVRLVSHTHGHIETPVRLRAADVESILRAVATQAGLSISAE